MKKRQLFKLGGVITGAGIVCGGLSSCVYYSHTATNGGDLSLLNDELSNITPIEVKLGCKSSSNVSQFEINAINTKSELINFAVENVKTLNPNVTSEDIVLSNDMLPGNYSSQGDLNINVKISPSFNSKKLFNMVKFSISVQLISDKIDISVLQGNVIVDQDIIVFVSNISDVTQDEINNIYLNKNLNAVVKNSLLNLDSNITTSDYQITGQIAPGNYTDFYSGYETSITINSISTSLYIKGTFNIRVKIMFYEGQKDISGDWTYSTGWNKVMINVVANDCNDITLDELHAAVNDSQELKQYVLTMLREGDGGVHARNDLVTQNDFIVSLIPPTGFSGSGYFKNEVAQKIMVTSAPSSNYISGSFTIDCTSGGWTNAITATSSPYKKNMPTTISTPSYRNFLYLTDSTSTTQHTNHLTPGTNKTYKILDKNMIDYTLAANETITWNYDKATLPSTVHVSNPSLTSVNVLVDAGFYDNYQLHITAFIANVDNGTQYQINPLNITIFPSNVETGITNFNDLPSTNQLSIGVRNFSSMVDNTSPNIYCPYGETRKLNINFTLAFSSTTGYVFPSSPINFNLYGLKNLKDNGFDISSTSTAASFIIPEVNIPANVTQTEQISFNLVIKNTNTTQNFINSSIGLSDFSFPVEDETYTDSCLDLKDNFPFIFGPNGSATSDKISTYDIDIGALNSKYDADRMSGRDVVDVINDFNNMTYASNPYNVELWTFFQLYRNQSSLTWDIDEKDAPVTTTGFYYNIQTIYDGMQSGNYSNGMNIEYLYKTTNDSILFGQRESNDIKINLKLDNKISFQEATGIVISGINDAEIRMNTAGSFAFYSNVTNAVWSIEKAEDNDPNLPLTLSINASGNKQAILSWDATTFAIAETYKIKIIASKDTYEDGIKYFTLTIVN